MSLTKSMFTPSGSLKLVGSVERVDDVLDAIMIGM